MLVHVFVVVVRGYIVYGLLIQLWLFLVVLDVVVVVVVVLVVDLL